MLAMALLLGGAALAAPASAFHEDIAPHYATRASAGVARVVKIGADTTLIKVHHLETLTIRNEKGQSFAWRFDTLHVPTGFPLKSIAPTDFDSGDTWVYVGPDEAPAKAERKRR